MIVEAEWWSLISFKSSLWRRSVCASFYPGSLLAFVRPAWCVVLIIAVVCTADVKSMDSLVQEGVEERGHTLYLHRKDWGLGGEKKECDGLTTSWEWWHQPADLLLQQTFDPLTHTGILFGKAVPAKVAVDGGNRWPTRSSERCIVKRWSSHPIIYTTRHKRQR